VVWRQLKRLGKLDGSLNRLTELPQGDAQVVKWFSIRRVGIDSFAEFLAGLLKSVFVEKSLAAQKMGLRTSVRLNAQRSCCRETLNLGQI
jgi:hypothetical protein